MITLKDKGKKFFIWILSFVFSTFIFSSAYAKEDIRVANLSKQIVGLKSEEDLSGPLAQVKDIYFSAHRYGDFMDYLKSLKRKKKAFAPFLDYYQALTRYTQLKYLEEIQDWNEYFSQQDAYRQELEQNLGRAINTSKPQNPSYLYAKLLFFKYHKDRQDNQAQTSLEDLANSAVEYAKKNNNISLLKDIADELSVYGEKKYARQVYALFVTGLVESQTKDEELKKIADGFWEKQNLDLAELVYDVYLKQIKSHPNKEEWVGALNQIAKKFVYSDTQQNDPAYAEKIFQEIAASSGKEILPEELLYLRAFNLEKAHEYKAARDIYLDLLENYASTKYAPEVTFKIGVIDTYILASPQGGKDYFQRLIDTGDVNSWMISSLYMLGLLNQWENNFEPAKLCYNKLITLSKDNFQDTANLAKQRLIQIEKQEPIEYNLKTFMDVALKKDPGDSGTVSTKMILQSLPYKTRLETDVRIDSNVVLPESGCTQIELGYLWSGDLGGYQPLTSEPSFTTQYRYLGTKVINLVVVSPSGIVDYGLDFVDAHN